MPEDWPELPYDAWTDTRDTLHMYLQVVGKVRLALAPFEPQWANVPLYLTARGLTTSPIPYGVRAFVLDVDLVDHGVTLATADGHTARIALEPRAVADFFAALMALLRDAGIEVQISPGPSEVPDPIAFAEDTVHKSYDRGWANRFFRVLSQVDLVMKEHRAPFRGRHTPVHFFWGTFDLAYARFSGRPAEPQGEDVIMRLSTDAEQIGAGFWPGNTAFPEPAFFSFAYPKPEGLEAAAIRPSQASWNEQLGEFLLSYDEARATASPRAAILDYLGSTYEAGARLSLWDRASA